jgi:hypothetical protein
MGTFPIFGGNPGISNLGGGKDQDLPLIGRIGQCFFVAGHGRAKHDFANPGRGRAKTFPPPN